MRLEPLDWVCDGGSNHCVVKVDFESADITRAIDIANSKAAYVNIHSAGGVVRSERVIKSRIITGKLADFAVYEYLRTQIKDRGISGQLYEYDEIRADGFQNPDDGDLILILRDKPKIVIEVRSSFCYKLRNEAEIIKKLSIYGWYTSYHKPTEPQRDWYWQFVYYLRPSGIAPVAHASHVLSFDDELEKGYLSGYIVGAASRALLNEKGITRPDEERAFYKAINPICSGLDCRNACQELFGP